ncbi:hypothetical protein MMC30_001691 [Trapelia coarctata]|nr:hypothetical protein [Trapelia coarctata]
MASSVQCLGLGFLQEIFAYALWARWETSRTVANMKQDVILFPKGQQQAVGPGEPMSPDADSTDAMVLGERETDTQEEDVAKMVLEGRADGASREPVELSSTDDGGASVVVERYEGLEVEVA